MDWLFITVNLFMRSPRTKFLPMPPHSKASTRGNVLFLILIAVALLAALFYTISRSNRGGVPSIKNEKASLDAGVSDQCTAVVYEAEKRLTLVRGCTSDQLSYEQPDGTNANSNAPADKHCNIFSPLGGGIAPCGNYAKGYNPCMENLSIGGSCNGVIYAGLSGSNRIYTTPTDQGSSPWNNGGGTWSSAIATSTSDGMSNTDTLVNSTDVSAPYKAAVSCRGLGPKWYLPSRGELSLLYTNKTLIGGFGTSNYYSSTDYNASGVYGISFSNGSVFYGSKNTPMPYRCVRRD